MTLNLRRAVGSLLVVGLGGMELTGLERAWLRVVRPAGIILFRRNIADAAQTRTLLEGATALCAADSLRCVDVEGGTVDRLRDALAPMPSAQAVARAAVAKGRPGLAQEHGELIARGVKAFGFNTTLAPVLDLGQPESAGVMGTRTAGDNAEGVTTYARGFLAGLAKHGVVGCGKHFPGLGGGVCDSHLDTPAINRSWQEIWRQDLAPYRELGRQLPMVMVNHAAYPETKSGELPASVSAYWMSTVLRRKMGYKGIVFSDDLEMGGVLKFLPIEEAALTALRAGTDLLEICHSPELILRTFEALLAEAERSAVFRKLVAGRAARLGRARVRLFGGVSKPLSVKQFEALRARVLRFGETVKKINEKEPA